MPKTDEIIDKVSKSILILTVSFVLVGVRVWGNDFSHGQTIIAKATADKDRAIIAAIEASREDAKLREMQTKEAVGQLIEVIRLQREDNRELILRVDALTEELKQRNGQ